ncbi:MAG: hypothetical protein RIR26_1637 [Pseudomonadota bacterium]|jgi:UDP-N-acetylglucosamine 2-epimerase (non-hydrolysing)
MDSNPQNFVDIMISSRRDAMHLAPVVHALRKIPFWDARILVLQYDDEDLDSALSTLELTPNISWRLRGIHHQPSLFIGEILIFLSDLWSRNSPSWVLIYGHSPFAFSCAFAAAEKQIPIANIYDADHPHPKDRTDSQMRNTINTMCALHFIANAHIRNFLIKDGIDERKIYVVGSLLSESAGAIRKNWLTHSSAICSSESDAIPLCNSSSKFIYFSFAEPERTEFFSSEFCSELNSKIPDLLWIVENSLGVGGLFEEKSGQRNVVFIDGASHLQRCSILQNALCVLSDSVELLDECAAFGTPGILLRQSTDRIDLISSGRITMAEHFPQNLLRQIFNFAAARKKSKNASADESTAQAERMEASARVALAITSQTNENVQKEKTSLLHPQAK